MRAHSASHQGLGIPLASEEEIHGIGGLSRTHSNRSNRGEAKHGLLLTPDISPGRVHRAYSHCPAVDTRLLKTAASRSRGASVSSSINKSQTKLYPTTQRRCSQAVAAFAATGDLEQARNLLMEAREQSIARAIREGGMNKICRWNCMVYFLI